MTTLHTFGCSITQGFALPDVVRPVSDTSKISHWTDIHIYEPSKYAWPQILADRLGIAVINSARRGACFQQIARQCAVSVHNIQSTDIVIVMWTYLSRLSLQWPARTSVPFCNVVEHSQGWRSRILPRFNKFFGLEHTNQTADQQIYRYIHVSAQYTYLDPMGVYNQYYNNLVLLTMTDGFLRATGARIIHLSVEPEPYLDQLESARAQLNPSLRDPYRIPHPDSWYNTDVDHASCTVIHDPSIPPAPNDMHPSVKHHRNFANHVYQQYFS